MSRTGDMIVEVCEWYEKGLHPEEVADSFGLSSVLVYDILEKHSDIYKDYLYRLEENSKKFNDIKELAPAK